MGAYIVDDPSDTPGMAEAIEALQKASAWAVERAPEILQAFADRKVLSHRVKLHALMFVELSRLLQDDDGQGPALRESLLHDLHQLARSSDLAVIGKPGVVLDAEGSCIVLSAWAIPLLPSAAWPEKPV